MKSAFNIGMILGCLMTVTAIAQQSKPVDVSNALEAQVNVSRDEVKNLSKLIGSKATQTFVHADYHSKMAKFKAEVDATMNAFDRYLAEQLLPVLTTDIDSYNSVVLSKDYTAEQKAQILTVTLQIINRKIALITPKYKEQILKLYTTFADYPNSSETINGRFLEVVTISGQRINLENRVDAVFQDYVVPMLMQDCRSYSCLTLTVADYSSLLSGINTKLDRDLTITLKNGVSVVIEGAKISVSSALRIMKGTAYPDEVLLLPMDAK